MKIDGVKKIELALNTGKPCLKTSFKQGKNTVSPALSGKQVSFHGRIPAGIKKTGLGWIATISEASARFASENWNIIITAFGTGLVAPLMIAKNPLAKDNDTASKYYMALRQPISAVLAVAAQLGTCVGIGKYIQNMAQNGELKNFDLTVMRGCKNALERSARLDNLNGAEKAAAELTMKRLKVFKDRIGFVIALMTIPVTCTILNWAHPRFIEVFFPDLAKDKASNKEVKK